MTQKTPLWRKALKIVLWTLMAVVLFIGAAVMCLVNVLDTPTLTRISNRAANRILDAEVTLGRVELSLMHHLPFLRLDIDSVTVLSGPMLRLSQADRDRLPEWRDTLFTADHFHGGINLSALLRNKIELHDVVFERPGINIVTLNDTVSNYLIYTAEERAQEEEESGPLPGISINSFRINRPHPLRYHNAQTNDHFTVSLEAVSLEAGKSPTYALKLGGNINMPALSLYNLDGMAFGLDGSMGWDPQSPSELELRDFDLTAAFLRAKLNAHVDFGEDIVVRDYDINLGRMGIERIAGLLPDSLRQAFGLVPGAFNTDLEIAFSAQSTDEFNLTHDSIPHARLVLEITPGSLTYGKARFERVGGRFIANLKGNDLSRATFAAEKFNIAGPATDLTLDATVSNITSDPLIRGKLRGHTQLAKLPAQLKDLLNGYLSGNIDADISFDARPSMFTRNGFHRLKVNGDIDGHNLYYLSADTNLMLYTREACFKLGTNSKIETTQGYVDSLLTASISIDTAAILASDISMKIGGFHLGAGVSNRKLAADTTVVVPMGGTLGVRAFDLTVLSDSAVFKMRDAKGGVGMRRYKGEMRRPEFGLDLKVGLMAAGSRDARFMVMGSEVHASAHKLPKRELPPKIKATADSLHLAHPDLPMDSVYRYAIAKHRRHTGPHRPRVHLEYTDLEAEIINWGTSKTLRRLLLEWDLQGSIGAERAGLFTPYFPLRNRVRNFNIRFNTDTIQLTNVYYKAGHSDFTISGRISNLKRGFTSRGFRSPLKINFDVVSDTIDVNELASSTFRGSAYAADEEKRHRADADFNIDAIEHAEDRADAEFEREMGKIVADAPDSAAPLLVPRNIDLRLDMRAANVLYSDLLFHNLTGELLAYQGALNLNKITAASDVGRVNLSALYSAPSADDLKFGFGLQVNDFVIDRFAQLVPAVDSLMPLLHDMRGIVSADIAATCDLDREMNFNLPTLNAAIRLAGDSLVLIDKETYRTIGKWLLFKNKQSNVIDHMNVELTIHDNQMELYPFMFDIDRYKLGVQGSNDLALNFNYHIAVLKSPLPFKFGVNIKGNPDDYKIRLGKARFNEKSVAQTVSIVDTARVNLINQIENIFRRGVANSRFANLNIKANAPASHIDLNADTISHADSLVFIREGLIPAPESPAAEESGKSKKSKKAKKSKKSKKMQQSAAVLPDDLEYYG